MINKIGLLLVFFVLMTACQNQPHNSANIYDEINLNDSIMQQKDEDFNKSTDSNTQSVNEYEINKLLIRIINDDLWFFREQSSYAFLAGTLFGYDIYKNRNEESYYVIPNNDNMSHDFYYLKLYDLVNEEVSITYHSDISQIEEMKENELIGTGLIDLSEIKPPDYDISEEEMLETYNKILRGFSNSMDRSKKYNIIAIRYYYSYSIQTIVLFTVDGLQYIAWAETNGERIYKPTQVKDDMWGYIGRIKDASYIIDTSVS
ncbi:MAG: hypothetical protein FWG42_07045 [Clostridiales bacterium]|nr:hypothetical protein [Clostridiales bacterium]